MTRSFVPLLLDEHYATEIAEALRSRDHDVVAVMSEPHLRSQSAAHLFRWAAAAGRRIVTENSKDFRPPLAAGVPPRRCGRLPALRQSARFPRGDGRRTQVIVEALAAWLDAPDVASRPDEDRLVRTGREHPAGYVMPGRP
ncbi:MAG: DUF5615 family PIN-like protein [Kineosporiaceae bacterium]